MAKMAIQRKRHFIDRSVQGAIVLRLTLYFGLFQITAVAFLYFVELLVGEPHSARVNLISRHGPTALAALALTPIFLRDLFKLTNRFAGPMMRLGQAMHDLAERREVSPIQFRDGDFWKEHAVYFNRIVERVKSAETSCDNGVQESALMQVEEV